MNSKLSQQRASPDAYWKHLTGQQPVSNSYETKLPLPMYNEASADEKKKNSQKIKHYSSKQGAHFSKVGSLAPVFEKSTYLKVKTWLTLQLLMLGL